MTPSKSYPKSRATRFNRNLKLKIFSSGVLEELTFEREEVETNFDLPSFCLGKSYDTLRYLQNRKKNAKISNFKKSTKKLDAGGKPSTLFPSGGLVDLSIFREGALLKIKKNWPKSLKNAKPRLNAILMPPCHPKSNANLKVEFSS